MIKEVKSVFAYVDYKLIKKNKSIYILIHIKIKKVKTKNNY
jgi:hypothetical protein